MATICWLLLLVPMMTVMVTVLPSAASASQGSRDPKRQPRDCYEILTIGNKTSDGVYTIYVGWPNRELTPVKVYCDMKTDGGGWTVLMRRKDGSVGFYRKWEDYKKGFGDSEGEFWLGNDNIHLLTSVMRQKLRVDLGDFKGNTRWAEYDDFLVGSEEEEYKLWSIGKYNGTAGDSFAGVPRVSHIGSKFNTMDHGDAKQGRNRCAYLYKSGWWHIPRYCLRVQLTGLYLFGPVNGQMHWKSVIWFTWKRQTYSLKTAEMKIRPFYA